LGFAQWIASVKPEIASLKQSKVPVEMPESTACRSIEASKGRWEPMRRSTSSPSPSRVDLRAADVN
jgi:NADH:ubiquinone oxidoreductase subunit D